MVFECAQRQGPSDGKFLLVPGSGKFPMVGVCESWHFLDPGSTGASSRLDFVKTSCGALQRS